MSRFERFKEAAWFGMNELPVVVGGVGGIGSWVALLLSRTGCNLIIYDMDIVEEINMAGQLYSTDSIDQLKIDAVTDIVDKFSPGTEIDSFEEYDEEGMVTPIMFSCFDNMKARKQMFENWKKQEDRELFIDGRLLAEHYQVFAVRKGQEEEYEKHLFSDDEVEEAPCSYKQTSHYAAGIASKMVACYTNYLALKAEDETAEVPFYHEFMGKIFYLECYYV